LSSLPKVQKTAQKKRLSVVADIPPCQILNTPELTQLLIGMNRLNQFLTMRLTIAKDNHYVQAANNWMFPYMNLLSRNTSDSLQAENINLFFWRSICQRQVTSKRASDASTLSAKQSANNDMLSKAERETRDLINYFDLQKKDLEKEENVGDILRVLSVREINSLFDRTYKAIRLTDANFAEESVFPKLDVFELSMFQGIFSNEIADNEYTNQSTLSKLLGGNDFLIPGVQQRRKKEKNTFKNTSDEAIAEEVKVLGKIYFKNVITFAVEEFNRLLSESSQTGTGQKESNNDNERIITKPEMITDKLKLVKFKMGSMASRLCSSFRNSI
jgi:hypothetical protein